MFFGVVTQFPPRRSQTILTRMVYLVGGSDECNFGEILVSMACS